MMTALPPRVYADWLVLLDRFRSGDNQVLEALLQGSIQWSPVVSERWTNQLAGAITARLQAVSRELNITLGRARSPFSVSQAMISARRSLLPIRRLASLSAAPEAVRNHMNSEVERFAVQTQKSLEESAQRNHLDSGFLLKSIRDNSLVITPVETGVQSEAPVLAAVSAFRGRRVIL